MIDFPLTIEPPDILVVEVLESLPGRPITGERLVRPDGTISLGFYGDLNVRGLTTLQAKVKVIKHLSEFLNDQVLGLKKPVSHPEDHPEPKLKAEPEEGDVRPKLEDKKPTTPQPPDLFSRAFRSQNGLNQRRKPVRIRRSPTTRQSREVERASQSDQKPMPAEESKPLHPAVIVPMIDIAPEASLTVFVDLAAHNSQVYYVQGDVGVPGRLPFTGNDTVFDAINYAGGFIPSVEPSDIHLYRPARGGKPLKDFKIDYDAIRRGESSANLQLFPGDRLVVGKVPLVKSKIQE